MQIDHSESLLDLSNFPPEVNVQILANKRIDKVVQVNRHWREQTENLWNERWNQYKRNFFLDKYVRDYVITNDPNLSAEEVSLRAQNALLPAQEKVKRVYQAVIFDFQLTFPNSEARLLESKTRHSNDALCVGRLKELCRMMKENRDKDLISFFTKICKPTMEMPFTVPLDLTPEHYRQSIYQEWVASPCPKEKFLGIYKKRHAQAIREWMALESSQPCLRQIIEIDIEELKLNTLPPEIKYLKNLEVLNLSATQRFENERPECLSTLPKELTQLPRLRRIKCVDEHVFKWIPRDVLNLSYIKPDGRRAPVESVIYSPAFKYFVDDKLEFLNKMIEEMEGGEAFLDGLEDMWGTWNDNLRVLDALTNWFDTNKEKAKTITSIVTSGRFGESHFISFPIELQNLSNLETLEIVYRYFLPEITGLRSLKSLKIKFHRNTIIKNLPNLTNLSLLEDLEIPLKNLPVELLALKNLKKLKIKEEFSEYYPDAIYNYPDKDLPCDEILSSSIIGIQQCLMDSTTIPGCHLRERIHIAQWIIKSLLLVKGIQRPDLEVLEATYREEPGKFYLSMRNWLVANRDLLYGSISALEKQTSMISLRNNLHNLQKRELLNILRDSYQVVDGENLKPTVFIPSASPTPLIEPETRPLEVVDAPDSGGQAVITIEEESPSNDVTIPVVEVTASETKGLENGIQEGVPLAQEAVLSPEIVQELINLDDLASRLNAEPKISIRSWFRIVRISDLAKIIFTAAIVAFLTYRLARWKWLPVKS